MPIPKVPGSWRWVAILALVVYVPWNAQRDLWFPDEPDVADPALSMLATGDWVVPLRNAEPWLDYPPMTYWLGAASSRLLGEWSPFALRLPIALMGILFVVLTAWVVERRFGAVAGLWTGLVMATAPQFAYQAVNFHPDMAFALFIGLGVGSYARGALAEKGGRALAWKIAGFALLGGAILSKGPLGLLLPGLVLFLWHGSRRQWGSLLALAPLGLVSLAVALPWYVAVAEATEGTFVWREVYLQNFGRFGEADRGHYEPSWFYYLWRIPFDWGPWILLLPTALIAGVRRAREEPESRLTVIWFLATLIFLSAAVTKRQVYLLPAYPAIAFLIGRHLTELLEGAPRAWFRRVLVTIAWASVALGAFFPLLVWVAGRLPDLSADEARAAALLAEAALPLTVLGLGLVAGGATIWWLARGGRTVAAATALVAQGVFFYVLLLGGVAPHLDRVKSYRAAVLELREESGDRRLGYYFPGAPNKFSGFRVEDPLFLPLEMLHSPEEAAEYLSDEAHLVVLDADEEANVATAFDDWRDVPRRDLILGSTEFVILGPRNRSRDAP